MSTTDIGKTSSSAFFTGSGGADAKARTLPAAPQVVFQKGIRIRAAVANLSPIYLGTAANVTPETGFPLLPGEQHFLEVDKASLVFLVAAPAANTKQTLFVSGGVLGTAFTLMVNGLSTAPIAHNATAADIQAALNAVLGAGSVLVSPGTGSFTLEFQGLMAAQDVPLLSVSGTSTNEAQTINLDASVTGGSFTLASQFGTTSSIPALASAADVQTYLAAICGAGNINVTGGPKAWTVQFTGSLAATPFSLFTGDGANLVGSVNSVAVSEVTPGSRVNVAITKMANASDGTRYTWIGI